MRVRTTWLVLLAASLSGPRLTLGVDGTEVLAASPKAEARGGADVAVGDSALSQIDNPATLTLAPRDLEQLDFAFPMGFLVASWPGPLDSAGSEKRYELAGQMGLTMPVDDRLTLGVAFHTKSGEGTRYDFRHLLIPITRRRVLSDMDAVDLEFNVGYKLTEKLSVGAGARLDVTTAKFSTVLGPVDANIGRGYAYGGDFMLGLHYRLRDDLAFGLAYRSPAWMSDLDGGRGKASLLGLLPIPLGAAGIREFKLPQKIATGLAWDATDWLKLVGEVRWLNYSNSFFHSFTVDTETLGGLGIPLPLGYRDQWAFMAGAEFKLSEHWRLGTGYHYATQAIPRDNLLPEGDALPHEHIMAGLRYEQKKWWAGLGYIIALPETLRGSGWSNIPLGFDYGLSEIRQSQHIISMGFGFRW
jgi:long-subunit fatty acid transport protein